MAERHVIEEAVFDISFDSDELALRQQSELGAFIQQRLLPLADEIFSGLAGDGGVFRIDELEIDLGDIAYDGFEEEMAARFAQRLESALRDKMHAVTATPSASEGWISRREMERGQLEYFLETGLLPPNVAPRDGWEPEQILLRSLRDDAEKLLAYVRRSPRRDIIVQRMARQFSPQTLAQILRLLVPAHADVFERLAHGFVLQRAQASPEPAELAALTWERVVLGLLDTQGPIADAQRFFGEVTQPLLDRHAVRDAGGTAETPLAETSLLAARLESALVQGRAAEIGAEWQKLRLSHPALLREIFLRRMGDEQARGKLAQGFPPSMLLELCSLLYPAQGQFIEMLSGLYRRHLVQHGAAQEASFWEYTLASLHGAATAGFGRDGYVRGLVRKLDERGIERAAFMQAIAAAWPGRETAVADTPEAGGHSAAETGAALEREARASLLYQRLARRLGGAGQDISADIEELTQAHPEVLERLLLEMQAGQHPLDVRVLGMREARPLVLFLAGRRVAEFPGLLRAVEAHAGAARDEQDYYQHILERLLRGELIDLEQAAGVAAPAAHATSERAATEMEARAEEAFEAGQAVPDRLELLRAQCEQALATGRAEGLAAIWSELQQHADLVREAFMRVTRDAGATRKLASGFPPALLFDLVRMLAPDAVDFVGALAAQPEWGSGQSASSVAIRAHVLAYLRSATAGFDRRAFVLGLVPDLVGQGVEPQTLRQAMLRLDAGLAEPLTAVLHEVATAGREPVAEYREALLRRIEHYLRAAGSAEMQAEEFSKAVGEIARAYPDALERLRRQLQTGDIAVDVAALPRQALQGLVRALVAASRGGLSVERLRALDEHTDAARDGYYRDLLERLMRGEAVDFESMAGEVRHAREPERETALARASLLRARLESAMSQGRAEELGEVWAEIRLAHADLVREVFMRLMGEAELRRKLVQGFPQLLLFDIVRLLVPLESQVIKAFAQQPEFRTAEAENLGAAARSAMWEYTLAYLHGLELRTFEMRAYVAGLIGRLAASGMERGAILRLVTRALIASAATFSAAAGALAGDVTSRAALLYERLLHRLGGASVAQEMTPEIEELERTDPETLRRLFRQLRAGEVEMDISPLGADEARALVAAYIGVERGGEDSGFLREIELHAGAARDLRRYYQQVLGHLVHNRIVDLEAAMLAQPQAEIDRPPALAEPGLQARARRMRARLSSALAHDDVEGLDALWSELLAGPVDVVPEMFLPQGGEKQTQTTVAAAEGATVAHDREAAADATQRIDRLYQRLIRRLGGEESDMAGEIAELARVAPERLERLRREIQAGVLPLDASKLGAQEARQLVLFYAGAKREAEPSEFAQAIERHVASARDERGYYRYILERLLRDEVVDLEAAMEKQATAASVASETKMPATVEAEHGVAVAADTAALYERLVRRLAGGGQDMAGELAGLVRSGPELLERLRQEIRAGVLPLDVAKLNAEEARQLVQFYASAMQAGGASEFLPAIEAHAANVRDERGYYCYILERLLRNEAVDLEIATGVGTPATSQEQQTAAAKPGAVPQAAASGPDSAYARLVRRLGGAGQDMAAEVAGIVREHAEMLDRLRHEIRAGVFPLDVTKLGVQEARSLVAFFASPQHEGVSSEFGRAIEAHAANARDERRYYQFILERLLRDDAVDLEAAMGASMPAEMRTDFPASEADVDAHADAGRSAASLYARLVQRLGGAGQDMAAEMAELAHEHPQLLERLRHEMQAGELPFDLTHLGLQELRELAQACASPKHAGEAPEFRRAIEAHAANARDERGYYRHILERLLRNEVVDLERAAAVPPETAPLSGREPAAGTAGPAAQSGRKSDDQEEWAEEVYIANAGMVLMAPFLQRLFGMLELTEGGRFRDAKAAERAVHLLEFAVRESCDSPEFLLVLNKLLCGVVSGTPIVRRIEVSARERETIEGMLKGLIQNWKIIGNTSVPGLRESFLQRAGRLRLKDEAWQLKVEPKAIDVLLDGLPWSFSIIKYPWMARPVYVEWR